jgi:hypothetical protein
MEAADQMEASTIKSAQGIVEEVDAVLADQAEALWANLDEGLRDWKTASTDQQGRLAALKAETR